MICYLSERLANNRKSSLTMTTFLISLNLCGGLGELYHETLFFGM